MYRLGLDNIFLFTLFISIVYLMALKPGKYYDKLGDKVKFADVKMLEPQTIGTEKMNHSHFGKYLRMLVGQLSLGASSEKTHF